MVSHREYKSITLPASGPTWSRLSLAGTMPIRLIVPKVGLNPQTPQ